MLFHSLCSQPFQLRLSQAVWRKTFSIPVANYSSTGRNEKSKEEIDKIASIENELKAFNEFNEGLNYEHQNKYNLAHEQFKRIMDILEMSNQKGSDSHIYILKKYFYYECFLSRSKVSKESNIIKE